MKELKTFIVSYYTPGFYALGEDQKLQIAIINADNGEEADKILRKIKGENVRTTTIVQTTTIQKGLIFDTNHVKN